MFISKCVSFGIDVLHFTLKSKLNVSTCNTRLRKYNTLICSYFNGNQPSITFKTFSNISSVEIVQLLIKVLACTEDKAKLLCEQNYEFLSMVQHDKLIESIDILKANNVLVSTVQDYFWLLTFSRDNLKSRLALFNTWNFKNPNNGVCILKLAFPTLMKLTKRTQLDLLINGLNRVSYFSSQVQCDEKLACELFMKYRFMMTMDMEVMKEHLKIIKAQEILTKDLLSDLWVFRYRLEFIKNRVKLLDEIGAREKCKVIKPWMLRCTELTINRYFELRDENMAALGSCSNLQELLSNELGLSSNEVNEMILKHPNIAKLSYCKAKDMINFLKAEGFNSRMIYNVPRVLCHKQATLAHLSHVLKEDNLCALADRTRGCLELKARLTELKKINPHLINLQNLCRNKKDFVALVNKMSQT